MILEDATAVTRDVSTSGVYFWTHGGAFTPGNGINFAVQIRRPTGSVRLLCRGDIVRTEQYEAMLGVAVRISASALEPLPQPPWTVTRR